MPQTFLSWWEEVFQNVKSKLHLFLNIVVGRWEQVDKDWDCACVHHHPGLSRGARSDVGQSPGCFKLEGGDVGVTQWPWPTLTVRMVPCGCNFQNKSSVIIFPYTVNMKLKKTFTHFGFGLGCAPWEIRQIWGRSRSSQRRQWAGWAPVIHFNLWSKALQDRFVKRYFKKWWY